MRMIERWFPCAEVSEASESGWGSGKSEKALFTWFAARPLAQAKAAVLTSLLPWPEDETEQRRLQDLVRTAMTGRDAAHAELVAELAKTYPDGASMLDPFSGRAMIPLEAARLGATAYGVDYSPVATLAGSASRRLPAPRLDRRAGSALRHPGHPGRKQPSRSTTSASSCARSASGTPTAWPRSTRWSTASNRGATCGQSPFRVRSAATAFPLTGSLVLRHPLPVKGDPGQSYRIEVDRRTGEFRAVVHDGPPAGPPTLVSRTRDGKAVKGKSAVCPFCDHVHSKADPPTARSGGPRGWTPSLSPLTLTSAWARFSASRLLRERDVADRASATLLADEQPFGEFPAVPNEGIPVGNSDTVRPPSTARRRMAICATLGRPSDSSGSRVIIADLGTELTSQARA